MSRACVALIAHGSTHPDHVAYVESVSRALALRLNAKVCTGYLEGESKGLKSIEDALRELASNGCKRIVVVPFFLTPGRHVKQDVPREIERARKKLGGISITVTGCVGEHPRIIDVVADLARKSLEG